MNIVSFNKEKALSGKYNVVLDDVYGVHDALSVSCVNFVQMGDEEYVTCVVGKSPAFFSINGTRVGVAGPSLALVRKKDPYYIGLFRWGGGTDGLYACVTKCRSDIGTAADNFEQIIEVQL